jgi:hypothetical protein
LFSWTTNIWGDWATNMLWSGSSRTLPDLRSCVVRPWGVAKCSCASAAAIRVKPSSDSHPWAAERTELGGLRPLVSVDAAGLRRHLNAPFRTWRVRDELRVLEHRPGGGTRGFLLCDFGRPAVDWVIVGRLGGGAGGGTAMSHQPRRVMRLRRQVSRNPLSASRNTTRTRYKVFVSRERNCARETRVMAVRPLGQACVRKCSGRRPLRLLYLQTSQLGGK